MRPRVLALLCLACIATLIGCGGHAGEAPSTRSGASDAEWSFHAREASIGAWNDRRPSGSTIRHEMLVLARPSRASSASSEVEAEDGRTRDAQEPPDGLVRFVVTTSSSALDERLGAILAGRIPVKRGMRANFALGTSAPVRIERVRPDGRRELVAETRVSFLEIER